METVIYIACGIFGVLGRLVAILLGGRRELADGRLQFRLTCLTDAWCALEKAADERVADPSSMRLQPNSQAGSPHNAN